MSRLRRVALIMPDLLPARRMFTRGVAYYSRDVARWELYAEEDSKAWMPDLRSWSGDGVIVCVDDPKILQTVRHLKIPKVGLEGLRSLGCAPLPFPCLASDNEAIGRVGAEHLISQGHWQLAFCGLPRNNRTGWAFEREQGFRQEAERAGVSVEVFRGRHSSSRHWVAMQSHLRQWLRGLKNPVGVMACSDPRARQVLQACRTDNIQVPQDVAVLGVDNDAILCDVTYPPLSSIDPGWEQLGYLAAELLDLMMRGESVRRDRKVVEPLRCVCRQSTDAMAMSDTDMAEALRFIRANACKKIKTEDVVEAVGVSRSTLAVRFKSATGRTVHGEVQRVRVETARDLILTTDLQLKVIAAQTGFTNTQHMSRLFRRWLRLTPSQLRATRHA